MSLHDRDYVREKNFNYKKMQYENDVYYDNNGDLKLKDKKTYKDDSRFLDSDRYDTLKYFIGFFIFVIVLKPLFNI